MRTLAAVLVLGLTACGADGARSEPAPAAPPEVSRVSFVPASEVSRLALLTGTLGGDPATGCLWVLNGEQRLPLVLQHDTAVLDASADPPVVRAGNEVLAAFGDDVELGGGNIGRPSDVAACAGLGPVFLGQGLRRMLPGLPPGVVLRDVRRACGPADGPALGLTAVVEGTPRLPLVVDVQAHPSGERLGTVELAPGTGALDVVVPFDDPFAPLPDEVLVTVSEGPQALAQAVADPRPGPACG